MTERITVRFEPDELQNIKRVARQLFDAEGRQLTLSDVVRVATVEYVNRVATEPLFSDAIGGVPCT